MYEPYFDIRERLGEPKWHDSRGVPRYCDFHPREAGVYQDWVALLEIRCQACDQPFLVVDDYSRMDVFKVAQQRFLRTPGDLDLEKVDGAMPCAEHPGWFHFGDAPWHGEQQCAGTTMTTGVYRVVEFWSKDGGEPIVQCGDGQRRGMEWRRRPEFEFAYPDGA
jgi:hypothetical protein